MGAVAVGAVLFAVLLLIVAVLVVQEARRSPGGPAVYVIEEVVSFAFPRLSEQAAARLGRDDVLRILEWEVFYLQGLDGSPGRRIAGGGDAVAFIAAKSSAQGHHYASEDIADVLRHEAAYLADIGALGPAVTEGS